MLDNIIVIGFIVYDIGTIVLKPTNPTNWYALSADIGGALLPGGTGFGSAVRGLENASTLAKSLSKLSKAERIAAVGGGKLVMSYKELKKVAKGTGLEAHHLIEKRFAKQLGVKQKDILSIAIDKETHAKITELYRKYIPYDKTKDAEITTSTATLQDIWNATKQVYTELKMTEYLGLLKPYFEGVK